MTLKIFKQKLAKEPRKIVFSETMDVIDAYYAFTPTKFTNGSLKNKAGENSGSCKLFFFAIDQKLSKEETLACFGQFYFEDVLKNLEGNGHQNIRNFMKTGFEGLVFKGTPLVRK